MLNIGVSPTGLLRLVQRLGVKIFVTQPTFAELGFLLDVVVLRLNLVVFTHFFSASDAGRPVWTVRFPRCVNPAEEDRAHAETSDPAARGGRTSGYSMLFPPAGI